jgi:formimidoylglutamate deiminase
MHFTPDAMAMSAALVRAAKATGIGLTLLPVLISIVAFFGQQPPEAHQHVPSMITAFLSLWISCLFVPQCRCQTGTGPALLTRRRPEDLHAILAHIFAVDATGPRAYSRFEQQKEVDDCLGPEWQAPGAWLMDNFDVDARWCLIHATHMDAGEYQRAPPAARWLVCVPRRSEPR